MALKKFFTSIASNSKIWLLLPVIAFALVVFKGRDQVYLYHQKYDINLEYSRYQNSAYFQGDEADYILSDEQVNVIRGIEQLYFKKDPINTLPGHPYLASYLYSLSILIFQNPYYASLLAFVLAVIVFYLLATELSPDIRLTTIITGLFVLDPLFNESIFVTMLDVYLLLFSLLSVLFIVLYHKTEKLVYVILSSLMIGFCLSTKFYPSTFPLLGAIGLSVLTKRKFVFFKKYILSLVYVLVGLAVGNFTFFIHHLNPIEFVRYQRYIQNWWAGSPSVEPFIVFKIVFLNQWHTWWGEKAVVALPYWTPIWGLLLMCSALLLRYLPDFKVRLLMLWVVLSFVMFSFMAIYPRHLLAVLPALYLSPLVWLNMPRRD